MAKIKIVMGCYLELDKILEQINKRVIRNKRRLENQSPLII